MSFSKAWNVPLDITRRHLKPSLKQKILGGACHRTPGDVIAFGGLSLEAAPAWWPQHQVGVRIFILSDSNFFQN